MTSHLPSVLATAPPPPETIVETLADLAGELAWPVLVAALVLRYRAHLGIALAAVATRLADRSTAVSIGQLTLGATASETLSVQSGLMEVLATTDVPDRTKNPKAFDAWVDHRADQYEHLKEPDYTKRVERKNRLADEIAAAIARSKTPRSQFSGGPVGTLAGVATLVQSKPTEDDLRFLIGSLDRVTSNHARYRYGLAFSRLITAGYIRSADDFDRTLQSLTVLADRGDEPVKRLVTTVMTQLMQSGRPS